MKFPKAWCIPFTLPTRARPHQRTLLRYLPFIRTGSHMPNPVFDVVFLVLRAPVGSDPFPRRNEGERVFGYCVGEGFGRFGIVYGYDHST